MALFIFAGRGKLISFSSVYAELKKIYSSFLALK